MFGNRCVEKVCWFCVFVFVVLVCDEWIFKLIFVNKLMNRLLFIIYIVYFILFWNLWVV